MLGIGILAVAFLVGALDFLIIALRQPRFQNAFATNLGLQLLFLTWAFLFGGVSALATAGIWMGLTYALSATATGSWTLWATALIVPLIMQHVAWAWPSRGDFGAPDQQVRFLYPIRRVWQTAFGQIERHHSHYLEQLANEYASVPWDETSLAQMHARIIPHYRNKRREKRINPQLLLSLTRFREQRDVHAFFYAVLEEFGTREVNRLLVRM